MSRLTQEISTLPALERLRLAEQILATLDQPDLEIDHAWIAESERRLDAYARGETTARDAFDVLAKHLP
jgi:putative addiction module component (TIGR02574 family)